MDTISSRDSNNNIWPLAGVIAGVLALILAIIAFAKVGSVNSKIEEQIRPVADRVSSLEGQIGQFSNAISQSSNQSRADLGKVVQGTNDSFKVVTEQIGALQAEVEKLKAGRTVRTPAPGSATAHADSTPVTPGTDVYVVKSGDTGTKIAAATGFSISQLEAVNPGINWRGLKVGQKVVLPKK